MIRILFVYDRAQSKTIAEEPFDDGRLALQRRFELERQRALDARGDPLEIVVLSAESREAMKRTHRRYFNELWGAR